MSEGPLAKDCTLCGACCTAPDIAALDKPLGVRCLHLQDDLKCRQYESRPPVCRSYAPDALCDAIAAPTLEERVQRYLAHFGLEAEAAEVRASGCASLQEWRRRRPG